MKLLNRQTVCEKMGGISPATLYRWIAAGKFPSSIQIGPNTVRWDETGIDDAILKMKEAGRK